MAFRNREAGLLQQPFNDSKDSIAQFQKAARQCDANNDGDHAAPPSLRSLGGVVWYS